MCEKNVKSSHVEEKRKLICAGLWGGIQNLSRELDAGRMIASLYSSSCDGGRGGDIYYFGICKGESLTRVAVADVVGHGQAVSDVAQYIYDALSAHMCDPDSGKILSEINQLASRRGLKGMTTAAVVAYQAALGELNVSYAGHPPVLFKGANETTWSVTAPGNDRDQDSDCGVGLPLAVAPKTVYRQQVIPVTSGDRLFIYTDGVTEAPNADGELFGIQRLNEVLDANADVPLTRLKSAVLEALHRHTGNELTHDDVTLIAMEVR